MGTVYLCVCERIPPYEVAVKRMLLERAAVPGAAERFLRECYHWLRLGRHPNVVAALSAHQAAPEPPILVLEYVPTTLRRLTAAGPMSVADALRAATDIVEGLRHATALLPGFVHRDLKPENVLVADDGTAKITDLGLSRALHTPASHTSFSTTGTPMYMAPEQVLGQPVPASDVYAVGCIAYELLVWEPVFGWSLSASDYQLRHRHVEPAPLLLRRPDVPAELAALIMSCLSKHASDRPRLDALVQGLHVAAARLKVSLPIPVADPPDPQVLLSAAQGMLNLGYRDDAVQRSERA
jgi:eukaryotic-like serine/threonine-protein kinase